VTCIISGDFFLYEQRPLLSVIMEEGSLPLPSSPVSCGRFLFINKFLALFGGRRQLNM
jgi:hypothetical protein